MISGATVTALMLMALNGCPVIGLIPAGGLLLCAAGALCWGALYIARAVTSGGER